MGYIEKKIIESDEEFWGIVEFIIKKMDITEQINFFTLDSNQEHNAMINRVGFGQFEDNTPGGLYINEENQISIGIKDVLFGDSIQLVAVIVHELCHLKLLYTLKLKENDEELTDLLTVFYGFGIFSCLATVEYKKWESGNTNGWSIGRSGYLNQDIYGYIMCSRDSLFGIKDANIVKNLPVNANDSYKKTKRYFTKKELPKYFDKVVKLNSP